VPARRLRPRQLRGVRRQGLPRHVRRLRARPVDLGGHPQQPLGALQAELRKASRPFNAEDAEGNGEGAEVRRRIPTPRATSGSSERPPRRATPERPVTDSPVTPSPCPLPLAGEGCPGRSKGRVGSPGAGAYVGAVTGQGPTSERSARRCFVPS